MFLKNKKKKGDIKNQIIICIKQINFKQKNKIVFTFC